MRVEEKLWSGIRVKKNSMSIFYVVLSTCRVVLPICHVILSTCSVVLSSLVPRPVRAIRVTSGGLEPTSLTGDVTSEITDDDWERGRVLSTCYVVLTICDVILSTCSVALSTCCVVLSPCGFVLPISGVS